MASSELDSVLSTLWRPFDPTDSSHPLLPLLTDLDGLLLTDTESQHHPTPPTIPTTHLYPLTPTDQILTLVWPAAQRWRKAHGLPHRAFQLTLTAPLPIPSDWRRISHMPVPPWAGIDVLDAVFLERRGKEWALELVRRFPAEERAWVRLAEWARDEGWAKGVIGGFSAAIRRCVDEARRAKYRRVVEEAERGTEWGVWTEEERGVMKGMGRMVEEELTMLVESVAMEGNAVPDTRSRLLVPAAGWWKLPRFFSWVVPARLAGMSTPKCREDIEALKALGVTRVVTLTAEQPLPREWFARGIANTLIPVANFFPPTEQQMDRAIRVIVEEQSTLVHCGGGKGRAGTILACYLALYGVLPPEPGAAPKTEARKAVELLRSMRPGSVETEKQERFVERYVSLAWKRYGQGLPLYGNGGEVDEPAGLPLEITGDIANADVIVLIGLQGSGKSTFSKMARLRNPSVVIVSPDEVVAENHQTIGSASAARSCEAIVGRFRRSPPEHPHPRRQLLLDRCNPTAEERKRWMALLTTPAKTIAVWFHYDADLCRARVENRSSHPSLPPWRAKSAIDSVSKQLQPPALSEGFSGIAIVRGTDSARELADQLFGPVGMQKFVRTRHLLDLGGATRDDLVVPPDDLARHFRSQQHVIVEEKIDGANLGISLGQDGQLRVQNRSHYVSFNDQAQFSLLPAWLEEKRETLLEILCAEDGLLERYVLYGEWMVATHSIEYTHLPDWFVAFDLYDRVDSRFFSRAELTARLAGTGIAQVPVLYEGVLDGEDTLLGFLERKSRFSPEVCVEGVVVRFPGGERGKVVRADFVAGNTHWSKHVLRRNRVCIE